MKSPTDFSFVEIRESWRTIKNVRVFSTFVRRKFFLVAAALRM